MANSNGASQNYFVGFSTIEAKLTKNWTYYDIDLIKRDLLNYFNTRVGERVMRPDFGCKIWDYLMEQLTPNIQDLITQEAVRICESDSRVIVQGTQVYTYGQGVRVELTLQYNPYEVIDTFYVDFDTRQDTELGFE